MQLSDRWPPYNNFKVELTCHRRTEEGNTNAPRTNTSDTATLWQEFNEISMPLWSLFSPCQSRMTFWSYNRACIMLNTITVSMATLLYFFRSWRIIVVSRMNNSHRSLTRCISGSFNNQPWWIDRRLPRKVTSFLSEGETCCWDTWLRRYKLLLGGWGVQVGAISQLYLLAALDVGYGWLHVTHFITKRWTWWTFPTLSPLT